MKPVRHRYYVVSKGPDGKPRATAYSNMTNAQREAPPGSTIVIAYDRKEAARKAGTRRAQ